QRLQRLARSTHFAPRSTGIGLARLRHDESHRLLASRIAAADRERFADLSPRPGSMVTDSDLCRIAWNVLLQHATAHLRPKLCSLGEHHRVLESRGSRIDSVDVYNPFHLSADQSRRPPIVDSGTAALEARIDSVGQVSVCQPGIVASLLAADVVE